MSYSQTLEKDLANVREKSKALHENRKAVLAIANPTEKDLKYLEKLRVEINKCRKVERRLRNQTQQLRNRFA